MCRGLSISFSGRPLTASRTSGANSRPSSSWISAPYPMPFCEIKTLVLPSSHSSLNTLWCSRQHWMPLFLLSVEQRCTHASTLSSAFTSMLYYYGPSHAKGYIATGSCYVIQKFVKFENGKDLQPNLISQGLSPKQTSLGSNNFSKCFYWNSNQHLEYSRILGAMSMFKIYEPCIMVLLQYYCHSGTLQLNQTNISLCNHQLVHEPVHFFLST